MPRPLRSAPEAADRPSGLRRPRRRTRWWPRFLLWAGAVGLVGACAAALLAVPVVVVAVCAAVLVVALFWRSRSRRSDGFGFVPTALVWTALGALILSLGATAVQVVMPELGLQWSREASLRAGVLAPSQSVPPTATVAASPAAVPAVTSPTPSATATSAPSSAAPTPAAPAPAPRPATTAPVAPAPVPVPPVQVVPAPPPPAAPTATPTPSRCSQPQSLTLGLLPDKSCTG